MSGCLFGTETPKGQCCVRIFFCIPKHSEWIKCHSKVTWGRKQLYKREKKPSCMQERETVKENTWMKYERYDIALSLTYLIWLFGSFLRPGLWAAIFEHICYYLVPLGQEISDVWVVCHCFLFIFLNTCSGSIPTTNYNRLCIKNINDIMRSVCWKTVSLMASSKRSLNKAMAFRSVIRQSSERNLKRVENGLERWFEICYLAEWSFAAKILHSVITLQGEMADLDKFELSVKQDQEWIMLIYNILI